MVRKGKEFNEIFDLTALRVLVDSVKDCYAALGIIHSLWKPLPGRFKDYIAMPKFNMYQSLHTTVIGPQGKPLEIQIRTYEMHETAQYGIAAHWMYKEKGGAAASAPTRRSEKLQWLRQIMDWQSETKDAGEFMESLRIDLFHDEVYVFTPKGEVKSLPAGSTPVDFAYAIHTDVGHRCVGAKVDGRIVPLDLQAAVGRHRRDPHLQDGPGTLARLAAVRGELRRPQQDPAVVQARAARGRRAPGPGGPARGLPQAGPAGAEAHRLRHAQRGHEGDATSPRRRTSSSRSGSGKISPQHVVTRVIQQPEPRGARPSRGLSARHDRVPRGAPRARSSGTSWASTSTASTTWPSACPSAAGRSPATTWWATSPWAAASPCTAGTVPTCGPWRRTRSGSPRCTGTPQAKAPLAGGDPDRGVRPQPSAGGHLPHPQRERRQHRRRPDPRRASNNMVKDRFVFEVPEIDYLETVLQRIRRIDTVYDAYRVTPH